MGGSFVEQNGLGESTTKKDVLKPRELGRVQDYWYALYFVVLHQYLHACISNTVKSFVELGPFLLKQPSIKYILSEVFSQDPLEKYFSRQRHRGGGADNPTVEQFRENTATLIQQQCIYKDLKTLNVEPNNSETPVNLVCQPLPKRKKIRSHMNSQ